jgi:hypothetical protein
MYLLCPYSTLAGPIGLIPSGVPVDVGDVVVFAALQVGLSVLSSTSYLPLLSSFWLLSHGLAFDAPLWGFSSVGVFVGFGKFRRWRRVPNRFGRRSHVFTTDLSALSEGRAVCVTLVLGAFFAW